MSRVHYAWVVAAVGFVTLITAAGFRSTTGILIVPLQDEFGWSRATIGVASRSTSCSSGSAARSPPRSSSGSAMRRVMIGALLAVSRRLEPDDAA